jgi:hypothetical protein
MMRRLELICAIYCSNLSGPQFTKCGVKPSVLCSLIFAALSYTLMPLSILEIALYFLVRDIQTEVLHLII